MKKSVKMMTASSPKINQTFAEDVQLRQSVSGGERWADTSCTSIDLFVSTRFFSIVPPTKAPFSFIGTLLMRGELVRVVGKWCSAIKITWGGGGALV